MHNPTAKLASFLFKGTHTFSYVTYGTYTCFTELIIGLRILFLYEGTHRYDKSEQIRIISHTKSDKTSTDTDISPS